MIKFKELNTFLETLFEGEETTGGAARSAHSDHGVHRVEDPEQLTRINAFLNAFTQREFIEPKAAVATLIIWHQRRFNEHSSKPIRWNIWQVITNTICRI